MNMYSSTWSFNQFISQAVVNAFTIALTIGFSLGTVHTAMVSQVFAMVFSAVFLGWCWKLLPSPDRKHTLPKGHSLFIAGFKQNCYMAKKIWNNYKTGLRWFLLSRVFSEAAASAVATTAVVFLSLNLKLNAFQIGMFFEVSLFGVIFGTKVRLNYFSVQDLRWFLSVDARDILNSIVANVIVFSCLLLRLAN